MAVPCFFATETIYQLWSSREVAVIALKIRKKDSGFINKLYRYVIHYHVGWMADEACRTQNEDVEWQAKHTKRHLIFFFFLMDTGSGSQALEENELQKCHYEYLLKK